MADLPSNGGLISDILRHTSIGINSKSYDDIQAIRNSLVPQGDTASMYPGKPIIIFDNGLADTNAGFNNAGAGGSITENTNPAYLQYSTKNIKLVAGPSAASTYITVDLTSGAATKLQKFLQESPDLVLGLLVYTPDQVPNNNITIYLTNQAHRIQGSWYSFGFFNMYQINRPGWKMLTLVGQRYGHAEVNGLIQQGMSVDTTAGVSNLHNNDTNYVDSIRLQVDSLANDKDGTNPVYIDSLWVLPHAKPTCMLIFDDCYTSQFEEGVEYATRKGIKGSIAVTKTLIGTAGYMTVAQLDKLYRAGWDLVNHANTHFDANTSSLNSICLSQTPGGAGNLLLNGSIGAGSFDAPRCITINPAANEAGTSFTITGLDEFGNAQTDILNNNNFAQTVSETVWTKITNISVAAATVGAITVGTTYSYIESLVQYSICRDWLISNGWTRAIDQVVYPNGTSNTLTDRALKLLGMANARTVSGVMNYQYPTMLGFNRLQIAGFGGGGATNTRPAGYGVVAKYNTGNGTINTPTFTADATPFIDWTVTMNAATTFNVVDQKGKVIGTGSTGVAFSYTAINPSNGRPYTIAFTVTAGGTPMVAGDAFKVYIASLVHIVEYELIRRRAAGSVYFHNIIRTGAQTSLDTYVQDYRSFIDKLAEDVAEGKIIAPTMSQFSQMCNAR